MSSPTTCRDALKKLAAAVALVLVLVKAFPMQTSIEYAPTRPAPCPDAAHTAIIDNWTARFDQPLIELEKIWEFLNATRTMAPADVDAEVLYDLLDSVRQTMEVLWQIEDVEAEAFFKAVTGQYSRHIYIERELNDPDYNLDW